MSKNNMVKEVKEQLNNKEVNKDLVINDEELKALFGLASDVLTVKGDNFLLNIGNTLELTLKKFATYDRGIYDTDITGMPIDERVAHATVINQGITVTFVDDNREEYIMNLLVVYFDKRKPANKVVLADLQRRLIQNIVNAARVKTINEAIGKKVLVTPTESYGNNGKRYTNYTIEAAE